MSGSVLEKALRHDRYVVVLALLAIIVLAWVYLLWLAADMEMPGMDAADMDMLMPPRAWTVADIGFMLLMWIVMMAGMMTPSAAPMILLYARVGRRAAFSGQPFAATGWFAAGYLLAWTGFSVVATFMQWVLERLTLLSPMMTSTSIYFNGIMLIAIGIYQWTPWKYACLAQCQAPFSFIQRHGGFRPEAMRSLRLGIVHGAYCVGCCWALMALLFVGGVMNIFWIAGIALLVLVEKVLPTGRFIPRLAGLACFVGGVWLLSRLP
ncbi:MAG: DUF2182 domain-containing protein [Rugosibacter sp.]